MALDIQYDADGCEGVLRRGEDTELPSLRVLAIPALLAFLVAANLAVYQAWGAETAAFGGVVQVLLLLAFYLTNVGPNPLAWTSGTHEVTERFTVRQGVLALHTAEGVRTAHLAGARIVAFPDGVWVNPALGEALRLSWDGASEADVARLVDALQSVAGGEMHQRGTSRDVPAELRKIRE
jgi:hypothetical protein